MLMRKCRTRIAGALREPACVAWIGAFIALQLGSCGDDAPGSTLPGSDAGVEEGDVADSGGGDASTPEARTTTSMRRDLIAAADGDDSAPGTLERPTTLTAALARVEPGRAVYLRGGTYRFSGPITIAADNVGSAGARRTLTQYRREAPILDFSEQPGGSSLRGLQIDGSYWRVVGLIVHGAADSGIYIAGSYNVIERCATYGNRGTGLQVGSASETSDFPSDNLILNCESFDNAANSPERANGFSVSGAVGSANVFRGCVAHHNQGDGWNLDTQADAGSSGVTIDQCVAHTNCSLTDGTHSASRDCTGFELGGAMHLISRSVAYYNDKNGFAWSGNASATRLINTLAFDNPEGNYAFGDASTVTAAAFANNVSVWVQTGAAKQDVVAGEDAAGSNRFWFDHGSSVAATDFIGALGRVKLARDEAGNLDLSAFTPVPGSALIDAGVVPDGMLPFDVAYYRGKPDLGAVETP